MINLTGGNVQNLAGLAQPNGSLTLQLNTDAVVIATPGFVPSAYQQKFTFDSTANLQGSCKIWSNAELNPPNTQYTATFRDASGARIATQIWQFIQTAGQTVDIGTIIPTAPAGALAAVPFSAVAANLFFAGPGSGAAAFPTFRAMVANDLPAVVFFTQVTTAALSVSGNATIGGTLGVTGITTLAAAIAASLTTGQIIQPAATALTIKSNQGGTYYSLPADGISQATVNNSKFAAPNSANNLTLLDAQDSAAGITGTGSPIVFYTKTILGGTVATGKVIHFLITWTHGTGSGSVSYTISLNGVAAITLASAATGAVQMEIQIHNTAATTGNAQGRLNSTPATGLITSSLAWASNQVLAVSFTAAGTEIITPGMAVLDLIQ